MFLAIDVGNTQSTLGLFNEDGTLAHGWRMATAATDTSYMGQIRPEDRIAVTTCVERIGTKSLTLLQRIVADDGTVRSQSRSVMVAFDFEAQQSVPVPDAWRRALEAE